MSETETEQRDHQMRREACDCGCRGGFVVCSCGELCYTEGGWDEHIDALAAPASADDAGRAGGMVDTYEGDIR